MGISKEEKKELLHLSKSPLLRNDFKRIKNRKKRINTKQYIEFLCFCNQLYGHKTNFHKIEGEFRL